MGFFARRAEPLEPMPVDPNESLVHELRTKYPYGNEAFNVRSLIRLAVWVNMQMRDK